jgi:hypothetical protein
VNFRGWRLHERILAPITLVVMAAAVVVAWFGLRFIGVTW